MAPVSAVDHQLAQARQTLHRVGPRQAADLYRSGALLVDIRPAAQRAAHGEIPAAVVIERNVLEWRLDPTSPDRHPAVTDDLERPVVVVCQEGYASSLAAASLQGLGLVNATDLDGGFVAWKEAGMPVAGPSGPHD